jgi:hypothetical protein
LVAAVHTIQSYGIEVSGGFIVGFDSDTPNIFLAQKEFIGRAGIPLAMVGMLTALPGTELELRLQREGRMNCRSIGNNTHRFEPNFTPRMPVEDLKRGYKQLLLDLYGPRLRHYFGRCRELLRRIGPRAYASRSITPADWVALVRTLWLGVRRRARWSFAAFLAWAILRVPRRFPDAVRLGAMGLHLEAITRGAVAVEDLRGFLATARAGIDALATACAGAPGAWHRAEALMHVRQIRRAAARQARRILRRVPASFRSEATQTYLEFLADVDRLVPEMHWPLRDPRELIEDLRRWLAAKECEIERAVGEAWAAVGHGAAAAKTTVRNAAAQRRAVLAEATRRARRLPTEYRIVARNEIDRWRDRWLDLVAVAPSRAVA